MPPETFENSSADSSDDSYTKPSYNCKFCTVKADSRRGLAKHIRTHGYTAERPFRCDICGRAFCMESNFKQHLEVHSYRRHRCRASLEPAATSASSSSSSESDVSLELGKNEQQVSVNNVCPVCGLTLTNRDQFVLHTFFHLPSRQPITEESGEMQQPSKASSLQQGLTASTSSVPQPCSSRDQYSCSVIKDLQSKLRQQQVQNGQYCAIIQAYYSLLQQWSSQTSISGQPTPHD